MRDVTDCTLRPLELMMNRCWNFSVIRIDNDQMGFHSKITAKSVYMTKLSVVSENIGFTQIRPACKRHASESFSGIY